MRRFVMLLLVVASLLPLAGCFNYDPEHNSRIWGYMKKDFRVMREDVEFWMGLESETLLDRTEY